MKDLDRFKKEALEIIPSFETELRDDLSRDATEPDVMITLGNHIPDDEPTGWQAKLRKAWLRYLES